MSAALIDGQVEDRFAAVRAAFAANFVTGVDTGAAVCMTLNGRPVVDLWGGHADAALNRPWTRDTLINVYSVTKTMTALCALLLADRRALDFDAPVAKYWPEFAANGKSGVKVSHLMSHSAGLSGWKEPMTGDDLYDWEKATSLLAAQAPYWAPGTACGYHAMTQGYLVGEVIRRVAGESVGKLFKREFAEPLGADFYIGLPASEDHRVADLIEPVGGAAMSDSAPSELFLNMWNNPPIAVSATRTRAWRAAEIPAAGGTGNARSVALVHSIMANGGEAGGKRYLSEAGVRRALEPQIEGLDLILGMPVRYGMGFGLPMGLPMPNPNTCFWGGYGGHLAIIDMDARASIAYTMNRMGATTVGDLRAFMLAGAFWQALAA